MSDSEFTFHGQRQGEQVKMIVKNHPFILFVPGLKAVLAITVGVAIIMFWDNWNAGPFGLICFLISILFVARRIYNFTQSVFIVTNHRVINVEQNGYLHRKITETELHQIQDITSQMDGITRILLKYGDLVIRTAGVSAGSEIVVKNVPQPYDVQQKVTMIRHKQINSEIKGKIQ